MEQLLQEQKEKIPYNFDNKQEAFFLFNTFYSFLYNKNGKKEIKKHYKHFSTNKEKNESKQINRTINFLTQSLSHTHTHYKASTAINATFSGYDYKITK